MTDDDTVADPKMQKRRANALSSKDQSLPLTAGNPNELRRIRRKRSRASSVCSASLCAASLLAVAFVGRALLFGSRTTPVSPWNQDEEHLKLPLSEFETVNHALEHASLVGLYFAASWCTMSTPVTNMLEEYFSSAPNLLYTPESSQDRHKLALVHVSSDTTQPDYEAYLRPGWIGVPYESEEQTALKKHFSVCAKREVNRLEIERKMEIPALIILDGKTHGILTTNGVRDLEQQGARAIDRWMEMQSMIRAMESKYQAVSR